MRSRERVNLAVIPRGRKDLSQWHSRAAFAGRVVDFSRVAPGSRVLEPSAGIGRIVTMLPRTCRVTAVEIDARLVAYLRVLRDAYPRDLEVVHSDFLDWAEREDVFRPRPECDGYAFDLAVMNPPFEHDSDAAHILSALTLCRRVVAVVRAQFLFGTIRGAAIWQWYRPARIAIAEHRPPFDGVLEASGSPRHDFVVVEIVPRVEGEMGKPDLVEIERWPDKW